MIECATAVAILQMYQMYSGGHLVQPPALSRANSKCRPGCPGLFQHKDRFLTALGKLFQCFVISQMKSENSQEAKIISCLQILLLCCLVVFVVLFVLLFFFKPGPLPIFVYFCDLKDVRSPFLSILIHFFLNWKAVESEKKMHREEISVSFF